MVVERIYMRRKYAMRFTSSGNIEALNVCIEFNRKSNELTHQYRNCRGTS